MTQVEQVLERRFTLARGFTLWFTGLSGAGKSTLGGAVSKELRDRGISVEVLDGDEVRQNLSKGLGFSREDRDTNIRRIGYVAKLLTRNGVAVITAVTSLALQTTFSNNFSSVCQGDSGGPLLLSEGGGWSIGGIISANSTLACSFGDNRCPLFDCVAKLAVAIVTMYTSTKPVAALQIRHAGGTYAVARSRALNRWTLHRGYRLTGIKPKLGVKRKRPVVKGSLQEARALATAFPRARQHRFHKRPSDTLILNLGIDRNRPNAGNRRAFVKTVAPQNLPARFGHYAIEPGMTEHHRQHARCYFHRRKVGRKTVRG